MKFYVVDAFTDQLFGGNQAGVVILREQQMFPDDKLMQDIASELKHSETAFVKRVDDGTYQLRYFTPEGEVPLCGHATVSAFTVLREHYNVPDGKYIAKTQAGALDIVVKTDKIWISMPKGETVKTLSEEEAAEVCHAYGLTPSMRTDGLKTCVVKSGLADILVPVESKAALDQAMQNKEEVIRLSKLHGGVGVHLYCYKGNDDVTAYCRNFAPLFGIDEEAATGTSNAALTHYLDSLGKIARGGVNTIVQGEAMGRPSTIYSKLDEDGNIWIGGGAIVSLQGELRI